MENDGDSSEATFQGDWYLKIWTNKNTSICLGAPLETPTSGGIRTLLDLTWGQWDDDTYCRLLQVSPGLLHFHLFLFKTIFYHNKMPNSAIPFFSQSEEGNPKFLHLIVRRGIFRQSASFGPWIDFSQEKSIRHWLYCKKKKNLLHFIAYSWVPKSVLLVSNPN